MSGIFSSLLRPLGVPEDTEKLSMRGSEGKDGSV